MADAELLCVVTGAVVAGLVAFVAVVLARAPTEKAPVRAVPIEGAEPGASRESTEGAHEAELPTASRD